MELTFLFDHRFFRDPNGSVFSIQNYNYDLFAKRYLRVFERIHILARVSDQPPDFRGERSLVGPGVQVHSLGNWQGPAGFLTKRHSVMRRLDKLLRMPYAVIMYAPGTVGYLAYKRLVRRGQPFGVEVIGDPAEVFAPRAMRHPLRPYFRWALVRRLRQQCADASAVSYVTATALQKCYPPSSDALSTHYSDIELLDDAFVVGARVPAPEDRSFQLVSVGSLHQLYKGPDILLAAIAMFRQAGLNASLVWVGSGQYQQQLEAQAEMLGITEQVDFVGQVPAGEPVRTLLDQADLFVLPSRTEGLPRALIEAMARGLPCIATSVGGIPELLPAEDMVAPDDPKALAQKLAEVARDPERLASMSARNLSKAKEYHADILQKRRDELYTYLRDRTADWLRETS